MPGLSADSLKDVSREAEATPGLQQFARVLTIQLQVLNGADDLCMHVSDHTARTHTISVNGGEGGEAGEERWGETKNEKGQRRRGKNKRCQAGCDKTSLLGHLRGKQTTKKHTLRRNVSFHTLKNNPQNL